MDYTHYIPMRSLKPTIFSLILGGILSIASPALAGTIMNLSDEPQTIELRTAGGYEEHIIKPDRNFSIISDSDIRYHGSEFRLQNNMNYAIWPDGNIGPQSQAGGGNKN